jgi:uncharacterized repeat protein (TIGR03803 family)
VFKLDTTGTETVLYSFSGGADGSNPFGLIQDSSGNLYGTTIRGGIAPGLSGYGVVFKLDAAGTETVLHSFTGGADGGDTTAGLISDPDGNLFGTASVGGGPNAACQAGCGVVFKIAP